jgi:predicted NACHT family NTPase
MTGVLDHDSAASRDRILDDALKLDLEPELKQDLQKLKAQLPNPSEDEERKNEWWQNSGLAWAEQLRFITTGHRNIGHKWQFSHEQKRILKHYYNTNLLLVECLNSAGYVTVDVRQEIEDTLLLPIAEIEKKTK